ncbi:MAG: ribosome-associated translation inhibitor RaiA [Bacteroidia bacterium]|nr:ribosome-associated translation inhibitor RaiA [Bacteroidia bacterium]
MQINFQTVNFKADQKLLDFITNKIEKLNKFENKIISVNVYLKVENNEDKDNKFIEILVNLKDQQLFMKYRSRTFEAAADGAVDSLKEQIKRNKEKRTTQVS